MEKFTKAWDNLNLCPVDVRDLPRSRNGKGCNCICVECKQALEACQGLIKSWYFRHHSKTDCKGGPMTALHLVAQHFLLGDHTIETPRGIVSYSTGKAEFNLPGSRYKADVTGTKTDRSLFAIELFVTHKLEQEKINYLKESKIHSLEIDLSKVDPNIKIERLKELLISDISIKQMIYSPIQNVEIVDEEREKIVDLAQTSSWLEDILPVGVVALLIWFGLGFLTSASKRKGKKR